MIRVPGGVELKVCGGALELRLWGRDQNAIHRAAVHRDRRFKVDKFSSYAFIVSPGVSDPASQCEPACADGLGREQRMVKASPIACRR